MSTFSTLLPALVLLLLLSACAAPVSQPYTPSAQPSVMQEDTIQVSDGTTLAMRTWLPENCPPKAVAVALHGFNDYSHAYRRVGETLRAQGIAVIAYDQRGYGRSGEFGVWPGKENLIRDLGDVTKAAQVRYPGVPLYIMGESMGGAVTLLAAKAGALPAETKGLILIAPALWGGDSMGWFYRAPLWVAAHTVPSMKVGGKNLNIRPSDNIDMLRELSRDPLVIKKSRFDTLYGIVQLMDEAYRQAEHLPFPTLFLYGAHDEVIPKPPVLNAMERLRDQRIAYYPHGFHMLTRDRQAAMVNGDIAAWILNPADPLPSSMDSEVGSRLATDMRK